jgi:ubiquinol-cytochrome c reductase cytochrome b subunit
MLRSVPQKLIGVLVMAGSLLILLFIPWLDTSKVRSLRFRPIMKQFFWFFAIDCVILGYCGAQSADAMLYHTAIPLVWIARICTAYYFGFFAILMWLVPLFETPKPLPASIAQPVLSPAE